MSALLLLAALASAEDLPPCDLDASGRSVWLLTVASAPRVDRAFGHTGLVLYEPDFADQSVIYDFGNFNAIEPLQVVADVVTGSQEYFLAKKRLGPTLSHYGSGHGRRVELQELELTGAQYSALAKTLFRIEADTPVFAYNWYTPNCTTKVRDLLDDLLDGSLQPQHQEGSGLSPARQVLRQSANLTPLWFGLHWGSGRLADQDISWWDAMFLPETLAQRLAASTVPTDAGPKPFVRTTCLANAGRVAPPPAEPPNRDALLWVLGVLAGLVVFAAGRTRAGLAVVAAQGLAVGVFGSAALFVGAMGTFAPFWTHHNLYFASPLQLGLVVAAALARRDPSSRVPERIALGLVGVGALGAAVSLAHGLADRNLGIVGLLLPVGVAAALSLRNHRS